VAARFITFEGIDGSGKSTHLEAIADHLRSLGRRPLVTHEPGGTALGERLRAAFLDGRPADGIVEALVVFASRRQHLLEVIEAALAAGSDVLCDRFTDSTLAYQGFGRGVPLEAIEALDRLATGARRPDLTLLFDLPPELARSRAAGRDPNRADRRGHQEQAVEERVRGGGRVVAGRDPGRVRVIDSSGEVERTAALTRRALDGAFDGAFEGATRGAGEPARGGRR
jgi:dTMP kinase